MNTTCYLCESTASKVVFNEHGVPLHKCASCGHVYSGWEQDEHYDQYWDEEIKSPDIGFWDGAHRAVYEAFLDTLRPRSSGTMVEVGCGLGFFVKRASEALPGWSVSGYEISPAAVDWAATHNGLEGSVHQGLVEEAGIAPGSVDVIVMWDVLEHIPRPQPLLRSLAPLLAPGGFVFVQTPNWHFQYAHARTVVALDRGVVPDKAYLMPKDHVNDYTRATLTRLARSTGFAAPSFAIFPPIMAVGGQTSRAAVASKVGLFRLSQLVWRGTGRHFLINPTLFAYLRPG